MYEVNEACKDRFRKIEDRLDEGADETKAQGKQLVEISTNLKNVTKSLDSVSRALWGVVSASFVILFGFVIWYIQNF